MTTSGGSDRKRSTTPMISQLRGRTPRLRRSARTRPAAMPVTTTSTASSMVTTTPDRMSGRYLAMTRPLKNVSVNCSHRDMRVGSGLWSARDRRRASVPLDLADERARPLVGGALEDRGGRPLLHDAPGVHEHHPVGGVAGEPHLVADHDHRHAALAERAHDLEHRAHELRVERARRLVEEHHARLERDGARDGHPLLLAAGELAGRVA